MAWSVDDIKVFIQFLINKNQAGGITVQQFQLAFNAEQRAYMDDLLGRFQRRSNDKTGMNTGLIENETMLQKLSPFTKPATLSVAAGQGVKPYGLIYTLALRNNDRQIKPITHGQISAVKASVIDPPNAYNMYYTEYETYFSFLPISLTTADLDYIGSPQDVVWGYTLNAYRRQVYNAATSVQPLWDSNSIIEICKRTLRSLGVHFKDSEFAQFGSATISTGD